MHVLASSQMVLVVIKYVCQCRTPETLVDPWVWKILWRRAGQLTPAFLPGKSHGQRSLASYSPWGHIESDMTEVIEHVYKHVFIPMFFNFH